MVDAPILGGATTYHMFCVAKITKINVSAWSIPTYPAYWATFEVEFLGLKDMNLAPERDMKFYAHNFFSSLRIFYVDMATSEKDGERWGGGGWFADM